MTGPDDFDTALASRFEKEHRQLPGDSFVVMTMRTIRAARRRGKVARAGLFVVALVAAVVASPWLVVGITRVNAVLELSLDWAMGQPVAWALAVIAVLVTLALRLRSH